MLFFFIFSLLFLLLILNLPFFFNDLVKFYFGYFFPDPSTIFFYSLINTHNYIMSLLFFVIILVTWILFIVLRDYFWGKALFGKNGIYFFSNFFFSFFFYKFYSFYLHFLSFFFFFIFNINFYINNILKNINFFNNSFIFNYYLKKKNNLTWKLFFFLVGEFSLRKGFYFDFTEQRLNSVFNLNYNSLIFLKNQQNLETFLYGNVITEGFSKQDSLEKPYVMQQFVHHFKLELFWAIFPTIKCLIILIPSLILLYSSASLKFYDNILQVTANQWYWNFSSNVLVETEFLHSFFFFDAIDSELDATHLLLINHSNFFDLAYYFNILEDDIFLQNTDLDLLSEFYLFDLYLKDDIFLQNTDLDFLSEFPLIYPVDEIFFLDFSSDFEIFFVNNNVEFVSSINNDSFMIADNDLVLGQQRVLDTDSHLIVSSLRSTKFLVNALDVLHSFVILSTGIKVDAIVGRINEMSVFFLREGLFFGQCSELCGSGHFGMPIVVESLAPFDFFGYFEDKKWSSQSSKSIVPYLFDSKFFDAIAEAEFNKFLSTH